MSDFPELASPPAEPSFRNDRGQFQPGNAGGPGRPRKTRTADVSRHLDDIVAEGAERIVRALIDGALDGNTRAAELLLSRAWPRRRGRPLEIADLPIDSVSDCVQAAGDIAHATLRGDLTAQEGRALSTVIDHQRRTIETTVLQEQIAALEARLAAYKDELK